MPENTVTHEMIRAGQLALMDQFADHQKHFRDTSTLIFAKIDKVAETSHSNAVALAVMSSDRPGYIQELQTLRRDVDDLKLTRAGQAGERGVLAAIAKSPFLAWLLAFFAAAWAVVANTGAKP